MKTHHIALLAGMALSLTACPPDDPNVGEEQTDPVAVDTRTAILGTWETVEIEVNYDSYDGGDTTAYELIREADFSRLYGAQPPQTVFTPDGKTKRTHRFVDGRVSDVVNGLWKVHNADTLLFIEPAKTLYFDYELTSDRLVLDGMTDSDFDGQVDDRTKTVMRLVAKASYGE